MRGALTSRRFLTLGIESSCDDTAVAVLEGPTTVRSSRISSQLELHAPYGGVVPELASRDHQERILPLVFSALSEAGVTDPGTELALIGVTMGPGLMGSLMVGVMTAKALAQAWKVPLLGVNHLEGHLFANVIQNPGLKPPFLTLLVSGGHTEVILARAFGDYAVLGCTRDDAAGEAYDKLAKVLGLGYPGGPAVDRLAAKGNPDAFPLPVPLAETSRVEFSFSGLKTASLNLIRQLEREGPLPVEDICASFQKAVVEALLKKVELAVQLTGVRRIAVSGGVAANSGLRRAFSGRKDWEVFIPPAILCTDNGVMVAAAAYHGYRRGKRTGLDFSPDPALELLSD
ncbi:MAG TPA: tRNA (adenosine(37)-N6)-threonylcarbamoyltransferase complex transferase subunit TsaD [Synergistales bacterium]|nr:tRNA (adenosine(37)-N6)-threonylcarbamoyltransferase complex transferase subunit TsaD [Synergistales bacterium]